MKDPMEDITPEMIETWNKVKIAKSWKKDTLYYLYEILENATSKAINEIYKFDLNGDFVFEHENDKYKVKITITDKE